MANPEIETLLKYAMGLKITAIGQATLDRAVNRRMKVLGLTDKDAYTKKIKASPKELKELVEEVVIPETWFFRDQKPFTVLAAHLNNLFTRVDKKYMARILSAPCSTGEEPYSICMALLEAGVPENRFWIDAVDISSKSLVRAQRAVFSDHSFRGNDLRYQTVYFLKNEEGYELREKVRRKVHFFQGNILSPGFMDRLGVYDAIFCRNLLIYLDELSQKRAVVILDKLLTAEGILFIGHAEAGVFTDGRFVPSPYSKSFAYLKSHRPETDQVQPEVYGSPHLTNTPKMTSPSDHTARRVDHPARPEWKKSTNQPDNLLQSARQLADQGKLDEAAKLCEDYLLKYGPSAQSYFLLGLIHDISGETEDARKLLKKAVYLEPDHLEGLVLLSLLSERLGDTTGAENYKRRAKRIQEKG